MHVLLPPSEAKSPGGRGRPLSTRAAHPLESSRQEVAAALARLLARGPVAAADALLLPKAAADAALRANAETGASRTRPALDRYAGVVYSGLDVVSLAPDARRLAARGTWIFSGLLGVVRGDEPVPDYRVPAKASLPGLGVLASYWRRELDQILPGRLARGLIVDLRSADYAAMWRADARTISRVVPVRVLSPRPDGGLGVISYPSKFAKGRLARALFEHLAAGASLDSAEAVGQVWAAATGEAWAVTATGTLELHARASQGL